MKVAEQIVLSVHRITVRCNGDGCMRQMAIYVSGGMEGSTCEALANVGWYEMGDEHFCLEHS